MEQNQNPNTSLFQLNLDAQNSYTLRSAASWAKVLGIVGFIIAALCVFAGIMTQQALNQYGGVYRENGINANMIGNAGLIGYSLIAVVYLVSSIFALNAGNKIMRGLRTNDQYTLNSGFAAVRNFFALWTILIIIFLLLLLIGLLGQMGK